jgi:hypothetical protein
MRFVMRLKDGESMASLCREFGISRKTGYKFFERYEECGLEGLSDRTRRLVSFMDYDLGYIKLEEKLCSPWKIPSGQKWHPCLRNNPNTEGLVDGMGFEPTTPALRTPCSPN